MWNKIVSWKNFLLLFISITDLIIVLWMGWKTTVKGVIKFIMWQICVHVWNQSICFVFGEWFGWNYLKYSLRWRAYKLDSFRITKEHKQPSLNNQQKFIIPNRKHNSKTTQKKYQIYTTPTLSNKNSNFYNLSCANSCKVLKTTIFCHYFV